MTDNSFSLSRLWRKLDTLFTMPGLGPDTVPQFILNKRGINSWLLVSVVAAFGPYLLLVVPTFWLGALDWFTYNSWWQALAYPVLSFYFLMTQPLFQRLVINIVQDYLPFVPAVEESEQIIAESYPHNRRREWLWLGAGVAAGWYMSRFWQANHPLLMLYGLIGVGLMFGLLGWTIYTVLLNTRFISTVANQATGRSVGQTGFLSPMMRWAIAIVLFFAGGSALSVMFLGQAVLLSPVNTIGYGIGLLVVVLVLLRSGVSTEWLSQFRVLRALTMFALTAMFGTLGYHRLEGWSLLDGLYMTIITMTTIGYGEIGPLSETGQIFTIFLSLAAVGIGGYAISAIAAFIVEGDFNRIIRRQRMDKQMAKMDNHILVCGGGRVGRQIAIEFHKTRIPFVLIDTSMMVIEEMQRIGDIPYVQGDATKDESLRLAGIERARGLVAALHDDKDNAFTVLSARALNSRLRIVARLTNEENAEKLRKVGADDIVSTNVIGGLRMASVMIRPSVVTFLDEMLRVTGQTLRMEEFHVTQASALPGKTLGQADIGRKTGLLVVAIKTVEGKRYQFNPGGNTALNVGDILIVIGTPEQLEGLRGLY